MTSEEQVDKVARAICTARWTGTSERIWDIMEEHEQEDYRRMARAAIEAMKDEDEQET